MSGRAKTIRDRRDDLLLAVKVAACGCLPSDRACVLLHGTALGNAFCESSDVDVIVCASRDVIESPAARRFYEHAERLGTISLWRHETPDAAASAVRIPLPLMFALSRARLLWGSPSVWEAVRRDYQLALGSMTPSALITLWESDPFRGRATRPGSRPTRDEMKSSRGGALDSQFLGIVREHERLTGRAPRSAFRARAGVEAALDGALRILLGRVSGARRAGLLTGAAARAIVRLNAVCVNTAARRTLWTSSSISS